MNYRPEIDGLRGIAVLSVVAYHAAPQYGGGGFVGVHIFFVISGFLISSIVLEGLDDGAFSFLDFYERRIRRIFPALIVVLLACLGFGRLALLADEYVDLGKHTTAAAGFYSNFLLMRETGYFDGISRFKILMHLWSLGIEEQFYLVWPVSLFLIWKLRGAMPWAIGFVTLLSFALNLWFLGAKPNVVFYVPFTRLWELSIGALLAYFSVFGRPAEAKLKDPTGWAGAALIVSSLVFLNGDMPYPGWRAAMPVLGAAMLILAGPDAWVNRRVLQRRGLVQVGLISYPLYLWHWPLLTFAMIVASTRHSFALDLACVAASFGLAWLTWRYVERGFRARRGIRTDIAALASGMIFAGGLGYALVATKVAPSRTAANRFTRAQGDPSEVVRCPDRPPSPIFCSQSRPGLADAVMIGDSHALHMLPGLAAIDTKRNWLVIGTPGCPPSLGVVVESDLQPDCHGQVKKSFDYVTGHVAPGVAVISFFGYYNEKATREEESVGPRERLSRLRFENTGTPQDVFFRGLSNGVEELMKRHKQVAVIVDVPELPFQPRDCFRPLFSPPHGCVFDRATVDRKQRGVREMVKRLKLAWPALIVFDPLSIFCDGADCTSARGEFTLYRDSHHLSRFGSREVARGLLAALSESGPIDS